MSVSCTYKAIVYKDTRVTDTTLDGENLFFTVLRSVKQQAPQKMFQTKVVCLSESCNLRCVPIHDPMNRLQENR